jgi:hypothetical protein
MTSTGRCSVRSSGIVKARNSGATWTRTPLTALCGIRPHDRA